MLEEVQAACSQMLQRVNETVPEDDRGALWEILYQNLEASSGLLSVVRSSSERLVDGATSDDVIRFWSLEFLDHWFAGGVRKRPPKLDMKSYELFNRTGRTCELIIALINRMKGDVSESLKQGLEPCDVLIVTALDSEFKAVLRRADYIIALQMYWPLRGEPAPEGTSYARALFEGDDGIWRHVGILKLADIGPQNAAIGTLLSFHRGGASRVLVVGIAGRMRDDINLGDVVISNRVLAYSTTRRESGREVPRDPRWLSCDDEARELACAVPHGTGLFQNLVIPRPPLRAPKKPAAKSRQGTPTARTPAVFSGDIMSGTIVVKEKNHRDWLRKKYETKSTPLLAIEMEGGGVHAAVTKLGYSVPPLVIKAISDPATEEKATWPKWYKDAWQDYAADVAATFVRPLLGRLPRLGSQAMPSAAGAPRLR